MQSQRTWQHMNVAPCKDGVILTAHYVQLCICVAIAGEKTCYATTCTYSIARKIMSYYRGSVVIGGGQTTTCRAMVLCATLDLPAKAKVLNFTQYNGSFGCTVCKEEGMVVKVGRGTTRVYKYAEPSAPVRSHKECFDIGKKALLQDKVCLKRLDNPCPFLHSDIVHVHTSVHMCMCM